MLLAGSALWAGPPDLHEEYALNGLMIDRGVPT
jgi:hypothetical protein